MIRLLSEDVEEIINNGFQDAYDRQQEYVMLENILYVALSNVIVSDIFDELDVDIKKLKNELSIFLESDIEKLKIKKEPKQTISLHKLIQRLVINTQNNGKIAMPEDLLISLFIDTDSYAVYILEKNGVNEYILKELATAMKHNELNNNIIDEDSDEDDVENHHIQRNMNNKSKKKTALETYAINLTEQAKDGKIDPIIGRSDETKRAIQILCRKKKNNPLLLGESGVGKTSIAEKLALDIVNDNVPQEIKDWEIFSIDVTAMIAGAKFRGDFEKRLQDILKELEEKENTIAFIDEFHTMFGLGAGNSNQLDATNILKPAMTNGKIRIMAATTYEEAKNTVDKNKPMFRRFQKLDILEPDETTTFKILKGLKSSYEEYHNVKYSDKILKQIVELTGKFITDKHFPDKAIDIIDELGSIKKLENQTDKKVTITTEDVIDIVSTIARVPVVIEEGDDKETLENLSDNIKSKLYGQDEAVDEITSTIMMARAGLVEDNKPLASFLLAGPSGTGKTEMARQLSDNLGLHMIRLDMSEFMEETGVAKMTGSAQGYVGYEEGGRLVNEIKQHPHSILLLDEFEKAHPKIQNTFLQILEEAELSSSDGTKAKFNNVIILFTTNAGTKISKTLGFGSASTSSKRNQAINGHFTPEFRNRLDGIINFNPLSEDNIVKVAEKVINEVRTMLKSKKVTITVTKSAKKYIADKGFDSELGARPMKRIIRDLLKKPIAKEIITGELKLGGKVRVDIKDDEILLSYTSKEAIDIAKQEKKIEKV